MSDSERSERKERLKALKRSFVYRGVGAVSVDMGSKI